MNALLSPKESPLVKVPDLEENDVIAFLDMGAYQEVSASNFNALPRPAMVMVNGDQAEVIKRAESIDDVFARDVIPERLQQPLQQNALQPQ